MQAQLSIARPYATAAFEQAKEEGSLDSWSNALAFLAVLMRDPQARSLVNDPRISDDQLNTLVKEVGGDLITGKVENFLTLLIENGRLMQAGAIAELFEQLRAFAEGVREVEVISAYEVKPEDEALLSEALKTRFGQAVRIETRTDESLIGGVVIKAGDFVIDGSMRGRLDALAQTLV